MTDHLPSTASAQSRWEHDLRIPSISYQFVLLVPPRSSLIAARFKKKKSESGPKNLDCTPESLRGRRDRAGYWNTYSFKQHSEVEQRQCFVPLPHVT